MPVFESGAKSDFFANENSFTMRIFSFLTPTDIANLYQVNKVTHRSISNMLNRPEHYDLAVETQRVLTARALLSSDNAISTLRTRHILSSSRARAALTSTERQQIYTRLATRDLIILSNRFDLCDEVKSELLARNKQALKRWPIFIAIGLCIACGIGLSSLLPNNRRGVSEMGSLGTYFKFTTGLLFANILADIPLMGLLLYLLNTNKITPFRPSFRGMDNIYKAALLSSAALIMIPLAHSLLDERPFEQQPIYSKFQLTLETVLNNSTSLAFNSILASNCGLIPDTKPSVYDKKYEDEAYESHKDSIAIMSLSELKAAAAPNISHLDHYHLISPLYMTSEFKANLDREIEQRISKTTARTASIFSAPRVENITASSIPRETTQSIAPPEAEV